MRENDPVDQIYVFCEVPLLWLAIRHDSLDSTDQMKCFVCFLSCVHVNEGGDCRKAFLSRFPLLMSIMNGCLCERNGFFESNGNSFEYETPERVQKLGT